MVKYIYIYIHYISFELPVCVRIILGAFTLLIWIFFFQRKCHCFDKSSCFYVFCFFCKYRVFFISTKENLKDTVLRCCLFMTFTTWNLFTEAAFIIKVGKCVRPRPLQEEPWRLFFPAASIIVWFQPHSRRWRPAAVTVPVLTNAWWAENKTEKVQSLSRYLDNQSIYAEKWVYCIIKAMSSKQIFLQPKHVCSRLSLSQHQI